MSADYLEPTGDWPGGTRYNLVTEEVEQRRVWTDAEKARAYERGERLPSLWLIRRETWTDAEGKKFGCWEWLRPIGGTESER